MYMAELSRADLDIIISDPLKESIVHHICGTREHTDIHPPTEVTFFEVPLPTHQYQRRSG